MKIKSSQIDTNDWKADLLTKAVEKVIVTHYNRPAFVIVSLESYEELKSKAGPESK